MSRKDLGAVAPTTSSRSADPSTYPECNRETWCALDEGHDGPCRTLVQRIVDACASLGIKLLGGAK